VSLCPEDHFDIEKKSVGDAFPGKHACGVAAIDLETALRVREIPGHREQETQREAEQRRRYLSIAVLGNADDALRQFARTVCKLAVAAADEVKSS
jgi:hypothetical protein